MNSLSPPAAESGHKPGSVCGHRAVLFSKQPPFSCPKEKAWPCHTPTSSPFSCRGILGPTSYQSSPGRLTPFPQCFPSEWEFFLSFPRFTFCWYSPGHCRLEEPPPGGLPGGHQVALRSEQPPGFPVLVPRSSGPQPWRHM